jgi:hypothetical protein
MVLGESELTLRMARPDKKTLVLSIGGARSFMSAMLKTATGKGTLDKSTGITAAMKYMPSNRVRLIAANPAHLNAAIRDAMMKLRPQDQPRGPLDPFGFQADSPLVFGVGYRQSGVALTLYVPDAFVQGFLRAHGVIPTAGQDASQQSP